MDDLERYGDYNDTDDEPSGRGPAGIIIKVIAALVLVAVIGVMGFRITIFNNYPKSMSRIVWTDALTEYYTATGGEIVALTQSTRLSYDHPKEGNFFFGELIIVPDAEYLVVTVRYNTSLMESIKTKYKLELDPDSDPFDIFDFKLVRTLEGYVAPEEGSEEVPTEVVGTIGATASESQMMYRYARIAFDGVDFGLGEGETPVGWYRLEIMIKGVDMKPYTLPVYNYGLGLEEYKMAKSEVPEI